MALTQVTRNHPEGKALGKIAVPSTPLPRVAWPNRRPHSTCEPSPARFAAFWNFLITRSRLSFEMWSMKRTPSRWSISCCSTVASSPSARILARLALAVEIAGADRGRALDLGVIFGDREAALLVSRALVGRPHDFRIDEDLRVRRLLLAGDVDDEEADRLGDLDRRKADAGRVVHRLDHVVHELFQRPVDAGDLAD